MSWLTRTVVRTSGPKPGPPAYVAWAVALIAIPLLLFFLFGVAMAVDRGWGVIGVVVGAGLFPVTLIVVPLHAALADGEWMLAGLMAALIALASVFRMLDRSAARYTA